MNPVAALGRVTLDFLAATGRVALFTVSSLSHCARPPIYPRLIARQMLDIGYYSLPVVGLTAVFTGMVLALQSHVGFSRCAAEAAIPNVVVVSITRELGPVLTGLMVSQTPQTVTIRNVEAIDRTVKRSDIEVLKQQTISLMPADIQKTMTVGELVNVIEYLTTLRAEGQKEARETSGGGRE